MVLRIALGLVGVAAAVGGAVMYKKKQRLKKENDAAEEAARKEGEELLNKLQATVSESTGWTAKAGEVITQLREEKSELLEQISELTVAKEVAERNAAESAAMYINGGPLTPEETPKFVPTTAQLADLTPSVTEHHKGEVKILKVVELPVEKHGIFAVAEQYKNGVVNPEKLGNKTGHTGYLDFVQPHWMSGSICPWTDAAGRDAVSICAVISEEGELPHAGVSTFFQRYAGGKGPLVSGECDSGIPLNHNDPEYKTKIEELMSTGVTTTLSWDKKPITIKLLDPKEYKRVQETYWQGTPADARIPVCCPVELVA
jgi:hypothetical protein